ncbi:SRPBCC family protein [Nocardioides panaciterrulae]|uniref:Putative membrane protein n=1 Tax=Nocardioides panaciterrulae TaxID=661492 RepID=A0A7Y9E384_9ACTN|nr:putative membrane protein [Nocardioides panaciterrulae]
MASNEAASKLKTAGTDLLKAAGEKAVKSASDRVGGLTERFEGIADGGPISNAVVKGGEAKAKGESPVMGAVKGMASGVKDKITGGGGKGDKSPKATKSTNIIESIDVGVPLRTAYNQWTEFGEFPNFMKKVEKVEAVEDNKLAFKAKIVWSHRTWEATILEQVPDERIVWRSKGEKGHVDGAVTFHEVAPNLTRILLVLEYYPQGLFEKTGNIWRAQGRRARAEFKHFRRHVMTRTILDQDEVEGWRGTIEDGEVVQTHEEALEEEQQSSEEESDQESGQDYDEGEESEEEPEDEYEGEESDEDAEDEYEGEESEEGEDQPEDEYEDEESDEESDEDAEEDAEEEPEDESQEDEYDEEDGEEEEPEDEYDEEEDEQEERRPRRRAS